jgi:four helix bundle protein
MSVKSFTDLVVWQEAHKLVLMIYTMTKDFPETEKYGLVSQMRRAAVSVSANIAEGFKRFGIPEKIRFFNIADCSLEELKYFLILSEDLKYITLKDEAMAQAETVGRLLNGLITSTQKRKNTP